MSDLIFLSEDIQKTVNQVSKSGMKAEVTIGHMAIFFTFPNKIEWWSKKIMFWRYQEIAHGVLIDINNLPDHTNEKARI